MRQAPPTETPACRGPREPRASGSGGVPTLRIANGMPLTLEPTEVRRDVRARRPQLSQRAPPGAGAPAVRAGSRPCSRSTSASVFAAIFTALAVKELVRGNFVFDTVTGQAWDYFPFVFLVTALVFALSGLYGSREERPGLVAIFSGLFWVTVVSAAYAIVNGLDFQSYYIFYGGFVFALAVGRRAALALREGDGPDPGSAGPQPPHDPRRIGRADRGTSHARSRPTGRRRRYDTARLHLAHPASRERAARPRPARRPATAAGRARRARGHHRRPRLPAGGGVRARGPAATSAASPCGSRPRRWRS